MPRSCALVVTLYDTAYSVALAARQALVVKLCLHFPLFSALFLRAWANHGYRRPAFLSFNDRFARGEVTPAESAVVQDGLKMPAGSVTRGSRGSLACAKMFTPLYPRLRGGTSQHRLCGHHGRGTVMLRLAADASIGHSFHAGHVLNPPYPIH